jgi:hypothetical protein
MQLPLLVLFRHLEQQYALQRSEGGDPCVFVAFDMH